MAAVDNIIVAGCLAYAAGGAVIGNLQKHKNRKFH
jgi:hypothetical protein